MPLRHWPNYLLLCDSKKRSRICWRLFAHLESDAREPQQPGESCFLGFSGLSWLSEGWQTRRRHLVGFHFRAFGGVNCLHCRGYINFLGFSWVLLDRPVYADLVSIQVCSLVGLAPGCGCLKQACLKWVIFAVVDDLRVRSLSRLLNLLLYLLFLQDGLEATFVVIIAVRLSGELCITWRNRYLLPIKFVIKSGGWS